MIALLLTLLLILPAQAHSQLDEWERLSQLDKQQKEIDDIETRTRFIQADYDFRLNDLEEKINNQDDE